jgi:hypothetical protein
MTRVLLTPVVIVGLLVWVIGIPFVLAGEWLYWRCVKAIETAEVKS